MMVEYEVLKQLNDLSAQKASLVNKEELAPLYAKIKEIQAIMVDGKDYLKSMKEDIITKKEKLVQMEKDAPNLKAALEDSKRRLNNLRGSSIKEQLAIRQASAETEKRLIDIDNLRDEIAELEKTYKEEKESVVSSMEELKEEYNNVAAEYNAKKKELDLKITAIQSNCEGLLEKLSKEELTAFEEASKKWPDSPVAYMDHDGCSGCKIGFAKEMVDRVKASSHLIVCDNCHRIIIPKSEALKS